MKNKIISMDDFNLSNFLTSIGVSESDYSDILSHGMTLKDFVDRIKIIQQGVAIIPIERALVSSDVAKLEDLPTNSLPEKVDYAKFTPSSGAASRMFKVLMETLNSLRVGNSIPEEHVEKLKIFISGLKSSSEKRFAFNDQFETILINKNIPSLDSLAELAEKELISSSLHLPSSLVHLEVLLELFLEEHGSNFSNKPKALIPFHINSEGRGVTPLEEHLLEAINYGNNKIHLTISEEHSEWYNKEIKDILKNNPILEKVEITFSYQDKGTDSPGLNQEGSVFRGTNGIIKFFPAGHGSLIQNLTNTPVAIIRNIDNVPNPKKSRQAVNNTHNLMINSLFNIRTELNSLYQGLASKEINGEQVLSKLTEMTQKYKLNLFMNFDEFTQDDEDTKVLLLKEAINRPFRILGVVRNQGEPGGGPFIVEVDGIKTISIVEKDELRTDAQKDMMKDGDFFNPVDIVFSSLGIDGNPIKDLTHLMDNNRAFVVEKTDKETGNIVTRMEHPGLWNGAMAKVNTVTVELPIETFAPVKEVTDLIAKGQHF
jgi:hypothetical protein